MGDGFEKKIPNFKLNKSKSETSNVVVLKESINSPTPLC